jgi:hypothetical protein
MAGKALFVTFGEQYMSRDNECDHQERLPKAIVPLSEVGGSQRPSAPNTTPDDDQLA